MSATLAGTEEQVFTALRSFLLAQFPLIEVVQGLDNFVPMPAAEYAVMTSIAAPPLGQSVVTYSDPENFPENGAAIHTQPTNLTIQVDFFGDLSRDRAVTIRALWGKEWSTQQFPAAIKPVSASAPRPLSFESETKETVRRCEIDLEIQYIPTVSVLQQFADTLTPTSNQIP